MTAPPTDAPGDEGEGTAAAVVSHLQGAALEVIAAVRAFLDAAEEAVRDPASVVATAASLADRARPRRSSADTDDGDGDGGDTGGVQRIPVS